MPQPNFTKAEFLQRLKRTRDTMVDAEIELLIVSDPSNMNWLTGYDGWSFYTHQAVIVTLQDEPIWWGRGMDALGAKLTVYMDHDNIVGYPDHYVQSSECHPMQTLAEVLKDRGWDRLRTGVEMDNYYFSASAWETLKVELPNAFFRDATGLVNWQRAIKSETEIEYMRRAARIVEAMHARIVELAEPGMRKNDLVAEIYRTSIKGADGHWGDYPAIVPMAPSGMDATAPHLTWDDQPLKQGESTFFEIAGAHRRYQCPQSRTLFLGDVPKKYLEAEKAVLEAVDAGLEKAKPGNFCEDIAIAFFDTLEKHGFRKDSRTGYAIGVSYPPDWGERTMSFRRGDKSVLKPGMTFHFMPALWLDDGGLEITEPILITESGSECLCNTPRELVVK
ncbi:MAG: ectoine hydrolase DoeA [Rhizobiaceae bacterium]|nr:ectoine hydrolase DoeA [Rhizobiaceae bacterium]